MKNVEQKREQIKSKIFKLLSNHSYSVVRNEVSHLGRQLIEIDNRFIRLATE